MANDIFFGSSEMDDLKFGSSQVDAVYLGSDKVWPASSSVLTVSINNAGSFKNVSAGNYAAIQRSTSGSGTGATFTVTLAISGPSIIITAIASIDSGGSGYAVSDTITLDLTSVADGDEKTYAILDVDSLG